MARRSVGLIQPLPFPFRRFPFGFRLGIFVVSVLRLSGVPPGRLTSPTVKLTRFLRRARGSSPTRRNRYVSFGVSSGEQDCPETHFSARRPRGLSPRVRTLPIVGLAWDSNSSGLM